MSIAILQPTDAGAEFFANVTAAGIALQVEWTGSGDDPAVAARIAAHLAAGARQLPTSVAGLKNCTLLGPLPTGDARHAWTGAEFARVVS